LDKTGHLEIEIMGIEQIITKIVDEAREETSKIRDEYSKQVKELNSSWDNEKKMRLETLEKDLKTITAREMDRQVIAEKLEAKKRKLAIKRTVVDEAFKIAREEFLKTPKDKYLPIIANIVATSALTGKETIVLSKTDSSKIGNDVVKKANELATARGLEGSFTLGKPSETLEGGAILKDDSVEIRQTISELVNEVRQNTEGRVLKALFEE